MNGLHWIGAGLLGLLVHTASCPASARGDETPYEGLVEAWKVRERGPFEGVRWFCADGAVLPPRPFACRDHGGGRQHGIWTETATSVRSDGLLIANVLAAIPPEDLAAETSSAIDTLTSVLIERYLMARDDGWIWRKALSFRGVLQDDDERAAATDALHLLLDDPEKLSRRLLLVREAVRLLPTAASVHRLSEVRALSNVVATRDASLVPLRNRIHTQLRPADSREVRLALASSSDEQQRTDLARLAAAIDEISSGDDLKHALLQFSRSNPGISRDLERAAGSLQPSFSAEVRLRHLAWASTRLRHLLLGDALPEGRLQAVRLSLDLESYITALGQEWLSNQNDPTREGLIGWLDFNLRALYGHAFLSGTEYDTAAAAIQQLRAAEISLDAYRTALEVLAQVPHWGARRLQLWFAPMMARLSALEPMAADFVSDRLRGSPLLVHSRLLTLLEADAANIAGVRHDILGSPIHSGLTALNPGMAQGQLRRNPGVNGRGAGIIALVPETVANLPPVEGLITAEAGNALSHVQLLAKNLGVPNVVASGSALIQLQTAVDEHVFLAVSPGGVVRIAPATTETTALLAREARQPQPLNLPQGRLRLADSDLRPLATLRASDSGRTVGPKAANLGELSHRFPGTVSPGLAIPFHWFKAMLDQPMSDSGPSLWTWLGSRYEQISQSPSGPSRDTLLRDTLAIARSHIAEVAFPEGFERRLRQQMQDELGPEGSYGVFVRSDTNIEDLPHFSGAGLNRTVPHVVGFASTLKAIREVWSSVFTERAWGWRQAMISNPIEVYAAVLLHKSVDVDVSGVLLTEESPEALATVAVNEGPGGGVSGQSAETLTLLRSGGFRFRQSATEPLRLVLKSGGGVDRTRASGELLLLNAERRARLEQLIGEIASCCSDLLAGDDGIRPADVEFGFVGNNLVLFQIRPVAEDKHARQSRWLQALDAPLVERRGRIVRMASVLSKGLDS